MQLIKLEINNFRNYSVDILETGPGINVIYGENGQGKTNLLEALYYLFSSISHRTRKEKELIKWDESFFKVQGEVVFNNYSKKKLQVTYDSLNKKNIKINNNSISIDRYFSQFPVVIFHPQDLYLVTEGPALRRRYLNTEITRIYPSYYHHLLNYYRALRQRNNILKKPLIKKEDLFSWDTMLASYGSKLIIYRLKYIRKIAEISTRYQKEFTSGKEDIKLYYKSRLKINEILNELDNAGIENKVNEIFLETLESKRDEEYFRRYTVVGPHVEDVSILLNDREIKKYSSQGQQRTAVISLKMAQAELLFDEKSEEPLLLMDDCFSELDEVRRDLILEIINKKKLQCLITSYEKLKVPPDYTASFFRVNKGIISDG